MKRKKEASVENEKPESYLVHSQILGTSCTIEDVQKISFTISINRKFLLKSTRNNNSTKFILHLKYVAEYDSYMLL